MPLSPGLELTCLSALLQSFSAVNGRNGSLLWRFRSAHAGMNFYTPQAIADIDEDGVPDLVQASLAIL